MYGNAPDAAYPRIPESEFTTHWPGRRNPRKKIDRPRAPKIFGAPTFLRRCPRCTDSDKLACANRTIRVTHRNGYNRHPAVSLNHQSYSLCFVFFAFRSSSVESILYSTRRVASRWISRALNRSQPGSRAKADSIYRPKATVRWRLDGSFENGSSAITKSTACAGPRCTGGNS